MTIVTNWYTMDNKEGVDLNNPQSISTTSNPDYPAPSAKLLDRVQGNYGSEWVFVKASTTVTAFMAVAIDDLGNANDLTSALIASNFYSYGIAEFQASNAQPGDYFWALLKANGGVAVQVSPSATKGSILYISPLTPGAFTSSATSDAINNIFLVASIGTSASGPAEAVIRSYMQPSLNLNVAGATA
jgi:hypothetical protein